MSDSNPHTITTVRDPLNSYPVHSVPLTRPFVWLQQGWDDLIHHCVPSLAYGLLVTALGAIILAYSRHPIFIAAAWVGFLLVGPILTAGCCELSRRQDEGAPADFAHSLLPLSRNRKSLLGVAQTLTLIALLWFALSGGLYLYLVGPLAPTFESTVWGDVRQQLSFSQLATYSASGLALCAMVFALSVVTIPMIVERHVEASTAMRMSLRVTLRELPVMLVWAVLIATMVYIGFNTHLVAMVLVFPLLSHATWRAYKELVH